MEKGNNFYHRAYELMQPLGILGGWNLSKDQHIGAISEIFPIGRELNVLYAGTATAKNPIDTKKALIEAGYDPKIIVLDIINRPLQKLHKKDNGIVTQKCNVADTCFPDKYFDVITTDFLLNMGSLETGTEIVKEMARLLKPDGIISMTVFTEENRRRNFQSVLIDRFGKKHFFPKETWNELFSRFGLDLLLTTFCVENKPLLYHSDEFTHMAAIKKT